MKMILRTIDCNKHDRIFDFAMKQPRSIKRLRVYSFIFRFRGSVNGFNCPACSLDFFVRKI